MKTHQGTERYKYEIKTELVIQITCLMLMLMLQVSKLLM